MVCFSGSGGPSQQIIRFVNPIYYGVVGVRSLDTAECQSPGLRAMYVFRFLLIALSTALLGGCATVVASAGTGLAGNLNTAIMNQDDPPLVRDGAPAYLLMLDSFVEGAPENVAVLSAAAQLYSAYGAVMAAVRCAPPRRPPAAAGSCPSTNSCRPCSRSVPGRRRPSIPLA
jgi:hypothetical protein